MRKLIINLLKPLNVIVFSLSVIFVRFFAGLAFVAFVRRRLVGAAQFFTLEHIEPVSPEAAQLCIHFYCFWNTQLEMHLLEGPD